MTQEEKELLLEDLCARLPHGVMVEYKNSKNQDGKIANATGIWNISHKDAIEVMLCEKHSVEDGFYFPIEGIKPYLRPMSSMTEEEKTDVEWYYRNSQVDSKDVANCIDYFNSHHLDYRGLIEKGLALEASEGMYITK